MKNKNFLLFIIIVGILSLSIISAQTTKAINDYEINDISHLPSTLQTDQNLTVEIVFYDDSDVNYTLLYICQLSPTFACEPSPIEMIKTAPLTYTGVFLIPYVNGTEVGYHIRIAYLNDTKIFVPDSIDFLGKVNIIEPITDDFYINAGIVGGVSKTSCCGILGAALAISTVTLIIRKKK